MDDSIHNIKAFACFASAPIGHTDYKTKGARREVRTRGAHASGGDGKPPPARGAPCGLLNGTDRLETADFTNTRKIGRLFLFPGHFVGCRSPPFLRFLPTKISKKRRDKPMWKNNDNGADESNILHRQFTVYLATAVRRTKIQYLRSKYRLQRYEIPLEIEDTLTEFQAEPDMILSLPLTDQLENIKLQRALEQAKKRDLYIFLAKVLEGRSFVEIAAELGIEYNTATAAYYRMLNRLRKELGGEDE